MHYFLFSLPFPAPTYLKSYRYLNRVLDKCFHGESYSNVECSIEQLEDANAINYTPEVIHHEIEANVADYYGNGYEILFLLSQGKITPHDLGSGDMLLLDILKVNTDMYHPASCFYVCLLYILFGN